jgi:hypothetical protein
MTRARVIGEMWALGRTSRAECDSLAESVHRADDNLHRVLMLMCATGVRLETAVETLRICGYMEGER